MSRIHELMPTWRLRQVDHLAVTADPERAYQAVRAIDLYQVAIARWLFALRLLPRRVAARLRGRREPLAPTARIEQITAPGSGFHLLADDEREVVVGSVGHFGGFAAPGWGKLAWGLTVAPRGTGSWITIDLRVDAPYWRLIGPFSHAIRHGAMRLLRDQLGAAPSDDARALIGDEILPEASAQLTHAIDIEAPPAKVWPWLLQMGGQRAGWYSWDRLDNAGKPSADRIIPDLQHLEVGDIIPARPSGDDGFEVLYVEPRRALIIGGSTTLYDGTWTFALEPIGDDATHLVTRYRAEYEPSPRMAVLRPALTPVHALMEHKQLRTIKARAEAAR